MRRELGMAAVAALLLGSGPVEATRPNLQRCVDIGGKRRPRKHRPHKGGKLAKRLKKGKRLFHP
jgi:hypothetical protein